MCVEQVVRAIRAIHAAQCVDGVASFPRHPRVPCPPPPYETPTPFPILLQPMCLAETQIVLREALRRQPGLEPSCQSHCDPMSSVPQSPFLGSWTATPSAADSLAASPSVVALRPSAAFASLLAAPVPFVAASSGLGSVETSEAFVVRLVAGSECV